MSTATDSASDSSSGCKLGRHDHWEEVYATELANLDITGDEGEVWFGAEVNETMADFTAGLLLVEEKKPDDGPTSPFPPSRLLDAGCGNGALVFALADRGFGGAPPAADPHPTLPLLVGLDYSPAALALAAAVAAKRGHASAALPLPDDTSSSSSFPAIGWAVADLVKDGQADGAAGEPPLLPRASFDAATDKGTLDAVGLSAGGPPARAAYLRGVAALLKPGGLFIVTSCNATLAELRRELCGDGEGNEESERTGAGEEVEKQAEGSPPPSPPPLFAYVDHVRSYPTFRFGGVEGSRVATVAVRKL